MAINDLFEFGLPNQDKNKKKYKEYTPKNVEQFGVEYNPENIKAYIKQDTSDVFEPQGINDFFNFKTPDETYNASKSLNNLWSFGLPTDEKSSNVSTKEKTPIEKALTSLAYTQSEYEEAGVPIPEKEEKKKGFFSKLWEGIDKYIFHNINRPQQALFRALYNVSDDDDSTTFLEGLKQGFTEKYGSEDILTGKDIVSQQLSKDDSFLRDRALKDYFWYRHGIKEGEYDKLYDNLSEQEKQEVEDFLDKMTTSTGFVADLFLDPLDFVSGVGDAAKLLTKGTDALQAADKIGDVSKAQQVLKALGKSDDLKDAEYLFKKTAKTLGYMDDYEGLKFAGKTILSPETIAKIGDKTGISTVSNMIRSAAKPVTDAITDNSAVKALKKMFVGGKNYDLIEKARQNPEMAMGFIALKDSLPSRVYKLFKNKDEWVKKAQDLEKKIGGTGNSRWLTEVLETPDSERTIRNIVKVAEDNPEYAKALKTKKSYLKSELRKNNKKLADLSEQIKQAQESGSIEAVRLMNEYVNLRQLIDELPESESLEFLVQLLNVKIDNKTISKMADKLTNPMDFATKTIDEVKEAYNVSDEIAVKIKLAAENTIEAIQKKYPEIADYYTGTYSTTLKEFIESSPDDISDIVGGSFSVDEMLQILAKEKEVDLDKFDLDNMSLSDKMKLVNDLRIGPTAKQKKYLISLMEQAGQEVPDPDFIGYTGKEVSDLIKKYKTIKPNRKEYRMFDDPLRQVTTEYEQIARAPAYKDGLIYTGTKEMEEIEDLMEKYPDLKKQGEDILNRIANHRATRAEVIETLRQMKYEARTLPKAKPKPITQKQFADYIDMVSKLPDKEKYEWTKQYPMNKVRNDLETYREASRELYKKINDVKPKTSVTNISSSLPKGTEGLRQFKITKEIYPDLVRDYPELDGEILEIATDVKTKSEIEKEIRKVLEIANNINFTKGNRGDIKLPYKFSAYDHVFATGKEKLGLHEFKVGNKTIKIADDVDSDFANQIISKLKDDNEVAQKLKDLTDVTIIRGGVVAKDSKGNKINVPAINIRGKGSVIFDNKSSKIDEIDNLLKHEAAHELGDNAIKIFNNLYDDINNLFSNPEQATEVYQRIIMSDYSHFKKLSEEAFKHGFISSYAWDVYKKSENMKGLKKINQINRAYNENLAEMAVLMFNKDEELATIVQKAFPKAKETFYNAILNAKKDDISDFIPKSIVKSKDEVKERLNKLKDIVDGFADEQKDIKAINKLSERISRTKKRINELEKLLTDEDLYMKWFNEKYSDKFPKKIIKETIEETTDKVSAIDKLPEPLKDVAKQIREDFSHMAKEEGVEETFNYVYHMLNYDLRNNKKAKKIYANITGVDPNSPFNIHELNRKYKGTIKEINKWAKEKYGIDDFFETNIVRSYLQRAINHERFMFQKELYDDVLNTFGEKIKKFDEFDNFKEFKKHQKRINEMIRSGDYVVVYKDPKYAKQQVRIISDEELENIIIRTTEQNADLNYVRKKGEQYSKRFREDPDIQGIFNAQLQNPFARVDMRNTTLEEVLRRTDATPYIVHKDAYEAYEKIMKKQFKEQKNALLKLYDNFLGIFKAQVTGLRPTFHVNNMIGNAFQSYMSVGYKFFDPSVHVDAVKIMTGKGKVMGKTSDEWLDILRKYGVIDHTFFDETTKSFLEASSDSLAKLSKSARRKNALKKLNPLDTANFPLYTISREIGSNIEDEARIVNFLVHVRDGKSYQEAADLVNKFLFDYQDITEFEANVMKRIIPFYTWLRKNIPLQIEQMFDKPGKYAAIERAIRNLSVEEDKQAKELKPKYLEDAIHIGDNKYVNVNLPMYDLKRLSGDEIMSSLSPFIRTPVELYANKNFYFDSPIQYREGAVTKAPKYAEILGLGEETPNGYMMNPKLKYAIKQVAPLLEDAEELPRAIQILKALASGQEVEGTTDKPIGSGKYSPIRIHQLDLDNLKLQAIYDEIERLKNEQKNLKYKGLWTE